MALSTGKKVVIGLGVLAALLLVVGGLVAAFGEGGGGEGEEVEVVAASQRSLVQVVTASGRVEPETEVKISPDVPGEIIELRVKEGDEVRAGQVLARIKPDLYAAQIEQLTAGVSQAQAGVGQAEAGLTSARTGVDRAQVDVERAQQEFDRVQALVGRGAVSAAELDAARATLRGAQVALRTQQATLGQSQANVASARFGVAGAQARLREAREQLGRTTIVAPMSGTVSQLNVELGERVVGTSQMAGTELMRIARLDAMELVVDVNENDVVNVSLGDSARIEVDAYPDRPFAGVVTEIAQSARTGTAQAATQQGVTNFQVRIRVVGTAAARPNGGGVLDPEVRTAGGTAVLRPGMSGTVDIFTHRVDRAVAVPIAAVTVRDLNRVREDTADGGRARRRGGDEDEDRAVSLQPEELRKVVFVERNGKAAMVEVETGIDDRTYVEVRRGLRPGDRVIAGPYSLVSRTLLPGDEVHTEEPRGRKR